MTPLMVSHGRCQFCHRTADDVDRLVAGDSSFICSDCIQSCQALLSPPAEAKTANPPAERYLFRRLAAHFAPLDPREMVAHSRSYPMRQQADLQKALDDLFGERRIPDNFIGVNQQYRHDTLGFSRLIESSRSAVEAAPAQYEDVDIGAGETVHCLKNGVWLLREGALPYAVVLAQHDDYSRGNSLVLEVMAGSGEGGVALSSRVFDALEQRLSSGSCYRGRVLSLEQTYAHTGMASRICVHPLEPVERGDVILPEATLAAVERNVLAFAEQRAALRAMGMSTQKGLLFHGAPGTGKTHCIRYLAGRLSGHTTFLITAEGVGLLAEYMTLARLLQPALVVIEDADLIARDRTTMDNACGEVLLNRLLNEMDGLREKADVFFILTTNRPEMLESALASRPGRIDQTIEFPLPDASHRGRLIALYGRSLPLGQDTVDDLCRRTEGASPAFIKELMRRIAQHHLTAGGEQVARPTVEAALHEMLFSGGALNTRLLGGAAVATA